MEGNPDKPGKPAYKPEGNLIATEQNLDALTVVRNRREQHQQRHQTGNRL
jgi:hypothetical protein